MENLRRTLLPLITGLSLFNGSYASNYQPKEIQREEIPQREFYSDTNTLQNNYQR